MNNIFKTIYGSHLYGTSTPDSDLDYKGIFLPTKNQILLGSITKSYKQSTGNDKLKNTSEDIDTEFYSLHYFIKLACAGQTVAMDMLHAPDDKILVTSDIWKSIVKHKHKFYSKKLNMFVRYARSQAAKYGIKGTRLNLLDKIIDILKEEKVGEKMKNVWDKIPRIEHCYDVTQSPNNVKQIQICGKIFQETSSISYVHSILEKHRNEYGNRAKSASRNDGIDWKAVYHALRTGYQFKEILVDDSITFPLKEAPYLTKVKQGKLDYLNEVSPLLEILMSEVEMLLSESKLPEEPDEEFWDNFLCDVLMGGLFKNKG